MPFVILCGLALVAGLVIGSLGLFIPGLILLGVLWLLCKLANLCVKTKRSVRTQK